MIDEPKVAVLKVIDCLKEKDGWVSLPELIKSTGLCRQAATRAAFHLVRRELVINKADGTLTKWFQHFKWDHKK